MTLDITLIQSSESQFAIRIDEFQQTELNTFKYTAYKQQDIGNDIDLENNSFLNINNDCHYYADEQYNSTFTTENKISIIHFNSRSMYANFHNIKDYLKQFTQPFNIILISETWINNERGMDFGLEGYELLYMNRWNKNGGGVAIYVDMSYSFKVIENMSTAIDNVLECLTIEISRARKKYHSQLYIQNTRIKYRRV